MPALSEACNIELGLFLGAFTDVCKRGRIGVWDVKANGTA
jgi:hypothetical protein